VGLGSEKEIGGSSLRGESDMAGTVISSLHHPQGRRFFVSASRQDALPSRRRPALAPAIFTSLLPTTPAAVAKCRRGFSVPLRFRGSSNARSTFRSRPT